MTPAREGMPELPAEVFVAITRGEGYEDVCDQLLAEDAFGPNNPFEWRVVDAAALSQPAQGGAPKWTMDCQGKQDYDGSLASVSTRYWPPNYRQDGLHSAASAVAIAGVEVVAAEFAADTEAQVKKQVVEWVRAQQERMAAALPHPQPEKACETCGGRGEVGGWSPGDGYDAELCPDCTTPPPPSDAAQGDALSELSSEVTLLDFGLSFALCNMDHAGTRRDIKKAQEHVEKIKALLAAHKGEGNG
jgi:hypothetical protein